MKKNIAEFLEFRYEKLKLLKRSERGEVWLASTRQGGELVILKRVMLTGLPYDTLKKFQFTLPAKIFFLRGGRIGNNHRGRIHSRRKFA